MNELNNNTTYSNDEREKYYNLLVVLMSFENFWNLYSVSEGELFSDCVREAAKKTMDLMHEVYKFDTNIYKSKELKWGKDEGETRIREYIKELSEWYSNNKKVFPFCSPTMGANEYSRSLLRPFFLCIKAYLSWKLQLSVFPPMAISSAEGAYHQNNVKWSKNLSWQDIDKFHPSFWKEASTADSIAVIADIRRSQDLMTYAISAEDFNSRIVTLIEKIREIIFNHHGIFDKFTGDGFLCYFNKYLCEQWDIDYYTEMLAACTEIIEFANPFFAEWVKTVRKVTPITSGLSIGVDAGLINFCDMKGELMAVGAPIVWASRMCSAAKKGEIVFNNIPYNILNDVNPDLNFEQINETTKGGEAFAGFKLMGNNSTK